MHIPCFHIFTSYLEVTFIDVTRSVSAHSDTADGGMPCYSPPSSLILHLRQDGGWACAERKQNLGLGLISSNATS